jgi:hypothetical protein
MSRNHSAFPNGRRGDLKVPERGEQKEERGDGRDEAVNADRVNKAELKVHEIE